MKTFSLAFILGIFVGALTTAYFSSPDSYQNLLAAKAELLGEDASGDEALTAPDTAEQAPELPSQADPSEPAAAAPAPAQSEPPSRAPLEAPPVEQPEPAPADDPQPEPETEPNPVPEVAPEPAPEPSPEPATAPETKPQAEPEQPSEPAPEADQETLAEKAKRAIESGAEKATELAETAKEKSATVREDAEPYLERGVDIGIAATIRAQFKLDRRIDSDAIAIEVKNRSVHLTGKVPTSKIKQLVIETAMGTKGVSQVTEELSVEP